MRGRCDMWHWLVLALTSVTAALYVTFAGMAHAASDAPVHLYGIEFTREDRKPLIANATFDAIQKAVAPRKLIVTSVDSEELDRAITSKKADIVIAIGGIYRRNLRQGMRDLMTLVSDMQPNPDRAVGALLYARQGSSIHTLQDLKGKTIALNTPLSFQGTLTVKKAIFDLGEDPEHFFGEIRYLGTNPKERLSALSRGEVDATFTTVCYLEQRLAAKDNLLENFQTVGAKKTETDRCLTSTELYPNHTIMVAPSLDGTTIEAIANAVASMDKNERGEHWVFASDFTTVDALYRDLRVGPYQYLNAWTLSRIWQEYGSLLLCLAISVIFAVWHIVRTGVLVRRATSEVRQAVREQRKILQQYESAKRSVTVASLSNILVHELGQPLSASVLYVRSLKKLFTDRSVGRRVSHEGILRILDELNAQIERSNKIVKLVRGYAKSNEVSVTSVDVREAVRQAVDLLLIDYPRAKEVLIIDFDGEDNFVQVSDIELQLAVFNILKNAYEAIDEQNDGGIRCQVKRFDSTVEIAISDNAAPVSEELLQQMKTPLKSLKPEGLGLGLSIVQAIVTRYFGKLLIERAEPRGLVFRMRFPSVDSER